MNYVYLIIIIVVALGFTYLFIKSQSQSASHNMGSSRDRSRAEAIVGIGKGTFKLLGRTIKALRGKGSIEKHVSEDLKDTEMGLLGGQASLAEEGAELGGSVSDVEIGDAAVRKTEAAEDAEVNNIVNEVSETASASLNSTDEQINDKIVVLEKHLHKQSLKIVHNEKVNEHTYRKLVASLKSHMRHSGFAIARGYRLAGKIDSSLEKLQSLNNSILKPARDAIAKKKAELRATELGMKGSRNKGLYQAAISKIEQEIALMQEQLVAVRELLKKIYLERAHVKKGIEVLRGDVQRLLELEAAQQSQEKVVAEHEKSIKRQLHALEAIPAAKKKGSLIAIPELDGHMTKFFTEFLLIYDETKSFLDEGLIPFYGTIRPLIEQTKQMGGHEYYVEVYVQEIMRLYAQLEKICHQIAGGDAIDKFPEAISGESLKVGYMEKVGYRINQYLDNLLRMHDLKSKNLVEHSQHLVQEMEHIEEAKKVIIAQLAHFTATVVDVRVQKQKVIVENAEKVKKKGDKLDLAT